MVRKQLEWIRSAGSYQETTLVDSNKRSAIELYLLGTRRSRPRQTSSTNLLNCSSGSMSVEARNCKSWTHLFILAVEAVDAVVAAAGAGSCDAGVVVSTAASTLSRVLTLVASDVVAYRKKRVRRCEGIARKVTFSETSWRQFVCEFPAKSRTYQK